MKSSDLILQLYTENPHLTNDQIADEVQKRLPGSKTSAASVSSVKSKAKKAGLIAAPTAPAPMAASTPFGVPQPEIDLPKETYEERSDRIRRRYATLERMAHRVAEGGLPSIIVSGPPGLGKSFTVEQVLEKQGVEHDIISGTITAPGLYIALYNMSEGGVVVLDDCDDVFRDETCLNLLKAVLDSSEVRRVSYRKRAHWLEEMDIPDSFEFKGSVVFCTNLDFEVAIAKGSSMAPHFSALMDRCLYLSLTMRELEDFIVRIHHVSIEDRMLVKLGLTDEQAMEVFNYMETNVSRFYSLSLRLMHQMAICYVADPVNWKDDIEATKMRSF